MGESVDLTVETGSLQGEDMTQVETSVVRAHHAGLANVQADLGTPSIGLI